MGDILDKTFSADLAAYEKFVGTVFEKMYTNYRGQLLVLCLSPEYFPFVSGEGVPL